MKYKLLEVINPKERRHEMIQGIEILGLLEEHEIFIYVMAFLDGARYGADEITKIYQNLLKEKTNG